MFNVTASYECQAKPIIGLFAALVRNSTFVKKDD